MSAHSSKGTRPHRLDMWYLVGSGDDTGRRLPVVIFPASLSHTAVPRSLSFALLLVSAACARERLPGRAEAASFRGVVFSPALEKPDFTFTDANGEPYNFRLKTAGKVALLFFGYTHCPDVCPLHAANIAAVRKQMPFEERDKIQFIFVTTDPERDTPDRLRQWLGAFDPSFVGLSGPAAELVQLQATLRVAPSRKEVPAGVDSSQYLVGHGAQVIAFGLDDFAHVEYPFGVRQEDWAQDLPRLARGEVPLAPAPAATNAPADITLMPNASGMTAAPPIEVLVALMPAPALLSEASVYLVLRNNAADDTLQGVWSPEAKGASLHRTVQSGGAMRMEHLTAVPIPGGSTLELLPGATHIMLTELARKPAVGESFPLRLRFAKGGELIIAPMVVAYAELEAQLRAAR